LNLRIKYIANRIHLDPAQKESIHYARKPVASNAGPAPKKKNSGKFLEKTEVYTSNRIGVSQENPELQANFPAAPACPTARALPTDFTDSVVHSQFVCNGSINFHLYAIPRHLDVIHCTNTIKID